MKSPHWTLAMAEAPRMAIEIGSLMFSAPWLSQLPKGDGHSVMIIPGFMGNDSLNRSLIKFLNYLGYQAAGWGMGRNYGPAHFSVDELEARVTKHAKQGDGSVTLIGHSLGGFYAREIARMQPSKVRQVISLGTPFADDRNQGSNASGFFNRLNPGINAPSQDQKTAFSEAPPVPTTSIYTKSDGVVNWRTNIQSKNHHQVQNIEVIGSHSGLTLNPAVWYLLADRLQHTRDSWQPIKSRLFRHH